MRNFSLTDYSIIRTLSVTTYDAWVQPPPIESLEKFFKLKPRNYTTVNLEQVSEFVLKTFQSHEPLLNNLSAGHLKILETSILVKYRSINFMDEDAGGDGLIVPTFMEIMSDYIFQVREGDNLALLTQSDKQFYTKYFWCYDQFCRLKFNQSKKSA